VPGIPRGAFIMLTPLFLAIGLPAKGIGILIAVDAIPDVFATVLNTTGHLVAAALVARNCDDRIDKAPLDLIGVSEREPNEIIDHERF
jgi:Na+/H+-dicarboxylate symporter